MGSDDHIGGVLLQIAFQRLRPLAVGEVHRRPPRQAAIGIAQGIHEAEAPGAALGDGNIGVVHQLRRLFAA